MEKPPRPFAKVRSSAIDGRVQNPFYKKGQLKQLHHALSENAEKIQDAMLRDSGRRAVEVKIEYWLALRCIPCFYDPISPDEVLQDEYAIANGKDAPNDREAVGVVVIQPTTSHAFLHSFIMALAPALAAGNCIIVQVEHSLLETPRLVLGLAGQALDDDIFEITNKPATDADIGRHIRVVQDGDSSTPLVNQLVSNAKAPVVAFVERDADVDAAAKAVVLARFGQRGKSPYAPDVVLVNEWVKKEFLTAVVRHQLSLLPDGNEPRGHPKSAHSRLTDEAAKEGMSNVVSSGSVGMILDVTDRRSLLLKRKVRQPCLVVQSVKSIDDAIDLSKSIGQLAAAYVFTTPAMAKYLCQFIDSSMSLVNQIPANLLYGPIAPQGRCPSHETGNTYDTEMFTRARPKFLTRSPFDRRLEGLLNNASPQQLAAIDSEATQPLTEVKRPSGRVDIGFFQQGIVTGLVLVLTTAVTGAGVAGYYAVGYLRPRKLW